jgi:ubiquinol-cytochrome c reductase cytochrome b subunit
MAEAFFGYLLPWGQMSYWGAQVITSLFGAIPKIGAHLMLWIRGDFVVSDVTLNRFFAFHVIAMPLVLCGLVFVHILALHEVGSNNPDGIEIKKHKDANGIPLDGIPFHPYYTVKDLVGVVVFLIFFFAVVFWAPSMGGKFLEHANFVPANALKTPPHIEPVWYFTPYYAILRAIPDKLAGVATMGSAVLFYFFLPWLDRSPVKSVRYRGWRFKASLTMFTISFLVLGYMGMQPPEPALNWVSRFFGICYFMFFLLLPAYTTPNDSRCANWYRYALRGLLWFIILIFDGFYVYDYFGSQGVDTAYTLFVAGLTVFGFFFEVSKIYLRDIEKPVPERVTS